ncbi:MAG: twin-arginine translocation signal domain-containing protein [Kiritimatiellia bacterium]
MNEISRRRFLQVAGAALVAVAAIPSWGGSRNHSGQKRVRIRPVPDADLRPGEMSFYRRARFETAADAMRAAASRGLKAEIYVE